jgi:hypothetical protein
MTSHRTGNSRAQLGSDHLDFAIDYVGARRDQANELCRSRKLHDTQAEKMEQGIEGLCSAG